MTYRKKRYILEGYCHEKIILLSLRIIPVKLIIDRKLVLQFADPNLIDFARYASLSVRITSIYLTPLLVRLV